MITPKFIFIVFLFIFFASLALYFLYKKGKKANGIILPKDLKESRAEYQARKEDDQRRFNK